MGRHAQECAVVAGNRRLCSEMVGTVRNGRLRLKNERRCSKVNASTRRCFSVKVDGRNWTKSGGNW
jgi:hypothetical protein